MTTHASVLSSPSPLNTIFDLLSPKPAAQDISTVVVLSGVNNPQEQPTTEQQYLVSRIDDLCDCV